MNRKIKYRVWDNENKSYDDPYSYAYYALTQDGRLDFYCHGDIMGEADPDVYLVELYTGLKDKNGEEIYVGDIVRIDSMDELRVGYVDLVNDQYCIVCGEDDEGYKIVAEFYYYSKPEENCEVIGNIHGNPELLGDTNVTNKEEDDGKTVS